MRIIAKNFPWKAEGAQLFQGGTFLSTASGELELGAMVSEDSANQFFVLNTGGVLELKFEVLFLSLRFFFPHINIDYGNRVHHPRRKRRRTFVQRHTTKVLVYLQYTCIL